jgi:hypothetical protein
MNIIVNNLIEAEHVSGLLFVQRSPENEGLQKRKYNTGTYKSEVKLYYGQLAMSDVKNPSNIP